MFGNQLSVPVSPPGEGMRMERMRRNKEKKAR